jgi:small subunit ribosomal protein S9
MAEQGFQTTITNPDLIGENVDAGPAPEQMKRELAEPKPADKHGWWWGVGRRKTAVARVRLRPAQDGSPKVQIQVSRKKFKTVDDYFSEPQDRMDVHAPLNVTDTAEKLEVFVRVDGGGITGQAQAIRLGIARALVGYDPHLEDVLREKGYLTRDARKVERKKYGQPGARRRFQFSKR